MDIRLFGDTVKLKPITKETLSLISLWYSQAASFGYATGGKNPEEIIEASLSSSLPCFALGIFPVFTENCIGLITGEIKKIREPVLWLRTLFVDTAWQRRHFGTHAFNLISDYTVKAFHIRKIFVSVSMKNRTGVLFWKSLGFQCVRLFRGSDNGLGTVLIFEKVVNP